jgi:arsenate reductase
MAEHYNVLFLCTDNSACSIFAEAILNYKGRGRNFQAYSAGSFPKGRVHPQALRQLESVHLPTAGLRSKSWREFSRPAAPQMDLVFAVCDEGTPAPVWPGHSVTGHWHVLDPTGLRGSQEDVEYAFKETFTLLQRRVDLLLSLSAAGLATLVGPKPHVRARAA